MSVLGDVYSISPLFSLCQIYPWEFEGEIKSLGKIAADIGKIYSQYKKLIFLLRIYLYKQDLLINQRIFCDIYCLSYV